MVGVSLATPMWAAGGFIPTLGAAHWARWVTGPSPC